MSLSATDLIKQKSATLLKINGLIGKIFKGKPYTIDEAILGLMLTTIRLARCNDVPDELLRASFDEIIGMKLKDLDKRLH